ncbi:hypothetical protein TOTORO_01940 [Serratia phage vB_SmaS-Totoro]|nr:hypothetical protein TOTORO_01940 [Serratia phage vB_SmaS-Totoro]
MGRSVFVESIHEALSLVPNENLPLALEAIELLGDCTPPWEDLAKEEQLKGVLSHVVPFGWVQEEFVPM